MAGTWHCWLQRPQVYMQLQPQGQWHGRAVGASRRSFGPGAGAGAATGGSWLPCRGGWAAGTLGLIPADASVGFLRELQELGDVVRGGLEGS